MRERGGSSPSRRTKKDRKVFFIVKKGLEPNAHYVRSYAFGYAVRFFSESLYSSSEKKAKGHCVREKAHWAFEQHVNTDEGIYKATGYKSTSVYTLKKTGKPSVKRYSSKSVKVSWKSIAGGSGYQISRSTTSKGTKIVSTISTTKGKSKVISAAKNKKYYYKVRAYKTVRLNGKTRKIYAPWSVVRKY